ncbi:MAG: hypothetical protein GEV13_01485 [Rhodospirillales bacterium]|nr:hypothetical protein [Rhodospirillales bacterium]
MAQASIKEIVGPLLAVLLLAACASPAAAQISIPVPGTGGSIQIGPQQDQRNPDQNRYYGGAASIRVLGAVYGRNCVGQTNTNVTNDLARQCQGRDYCVYRIDHRQLGDPRPGCAKDYQARYLCRDGGNERYASASPEASGQSVVLDCRRQ